MEFSVKSAANICFLWLMSQAAGWEIGNRFAGAVHCRYSFDADHGRFAGFACDNVIDFWQPIFRISCNTQIILEKQLNCAICPHDQRGVHRAIGANL